MYNYLERRVIANEEMLFLVFQNLANLCIPQISNNVNVIEGIDTSGMKKNFFSILVAQMTKKEFCSLCIPTVSQLSYLSLKLVLLFLFK